MVREMADKGLFEGKFGSRENGTIWLNIAYNLNSCKEFAVTAQSITTLMKNYKSQLLA